MLFGRFFRRENPLTDEVKQELISQLLVEMVWADGDTHESELSHIIHVLARRFKVDDSEVKKMAGGFARLDKRGIETIARKICKAVPARERVMLLRDLWAIASSDGEIDPYEHTLFHRVAGLLHINDTGFLEKCVKTGV